VTARLLALAAALLVRLGFPLLPLAESGPAAPLIVPSYAPGAIAVVPRPLGLPGRYTPQTGGEP
jgi:hypothetical protein